MTTDEIHTELDLVERQIEEARLTVRREIDRLEDEYNEEYKRLTAKRLALYKELYNR